MIKLSRLTDYAVTLLTQMVNEGQALWTTNDLAEKTGLSISTSSKILKQLAKNGIIVAQRGAQGGYHLSRPAATISIANIIEAMDGPIALTDCAEGGEQNCRVEKLCPMSGNWDRINRAVKNALEEVSLADMAVPSPHKTVRPHQDIVLQAVGE